MKTYKWNNAELKRKKKNYDLMMMLAMLTALVFIAGFAQFTAAMGCLVIAFIFMVLGWRTQSQDRQLKKTGVKTVN